METPIRLNMLSPTNPQTDEANTYSYKINNLTQKQEVSFHFFPFQKQVVTFQPD